MEKMIWLSLEICVSDVSEVYLPNDNTSENYWVLEGTCRRPRMREIKKHKLDHGDEAKHLGAFVLAGAVQNYCVLLKLFKVF